MWCFELDNNKKHDQILGNTQRRMLRLTIRTKRKYKRKKNKEDFDGEDIKNDEMSEDAQEEDGTIDEYDQDSSISFENVRAHRIKKMN